MVTKQLELVQTTQSKYKHVHFLKYKDLGKWYVSLYINKIDLQSSFPSEKLKHLIKPIKTKIRKAEYKNDYRVVKKVSFADGQIHIRAKNETNMDLYVLPSKALLISKINFHQGAIAINHFEDLVCTTHYQPYTINAEKVDGEYLVMVLRSSSFKANVSRQKADGIKNEATFEFIGDLEIPLPTLKEQKAIVDAYNKTMALANQQEEEADEIKLKTEEYFYKTIGVNINNHPEKNPSTKIKFIKYSSISKWALSHILKHQLFTLHDSKFQKLTIRKVLSEFEGGKTPRTTRSDYWNGNINWVSPKDFSGLKMDNSEDFITEKATKEAGLKIFPVGTVLGVFRSGILRHSFPVALTQIPVTINQDLKAMTVNSNLITPEYFLHYLHFMQKYILEKSSKVGVTVESINTDEFLEIEIVVPPIQKQQDIIQEVKNKLNKTDGVFNNSKNLANKAQQDFENTIFKQ